MKYVIKDWTGATLFNEKTFDEFEDAWGFLYERYPDCEDGTFDDYQVVTTESPRDVRGKKRNHNEKT